MALYRRGKIWWMDLYVGNGRKRVRKSTGTDDENKARIVEQTAMSVNRGVTARQRAVAIIDALMPEEEQGLALARAAAWYEDAAKGEGTDMTTSFMRQRLNIIAKFAEWARRNTRAVRTEDVDAPVAFAYAKALGDPKRGIIARTRNTYLSELGTAWRLFMRHDRAKMNPWPLVKVKRNRDEEHTGRAFTPDEVARLLAEGRKAGHGWETAMLIALYTGLRQGDATRLRWTDIDFKERVIRVEPRKTKRHGITVTIPMHPKLEAHLRTLKEAAQGEWVTPERRLRVGAQKAKDGNPVFNDLLAAAKVERTSERDKLTFHCFRHTFVSRLAEAGVAADVRMRLAGHTSAENHAIYTHGDAGARAAIEKLG